jgi:acylphosphatase
VQGVGFRFYVRGSARKHKLTGWARNCFDGSVEIEAQGTAEEMAAFRDEVEQGPPLSHVLDFKVIDLPPVTGETVFEIRF